MAMFMPKNVHFIFCRHLLNEHQGHRVSSTPALLPSGSFPTAACITNMQQKVILAHIPTSGTPGQMSFATHPVNSNQKLQQIHSGQNTVLPILRPIQPGSPLLIPTTSGPRALIQTQQIVVSLETFIIRF